MSGMWPQGIRPSVAEMPSFLNSRSTLEYEPYSTAKNAPMGMTQYKDHVEQLMRFFGQPKKPILIDPEDSYDKEHLDLPDAYEGKNLRMRNILIDMIQESELYPIRVLFPLQRNEDSMTIQWDTWNFNMHQLNRQPEESTPRLLSFNKSSAQESFVRYGIGLMLEHGFYKTPMGRETYMMHLVQIRNATVETMAFGAMVAAVNHAKYKDPNDLYRQTAARDKSMLERLLSEERNRWAQAQKTPYGLRLAESALSRIMISRNGMDADSVVIPDRMFDNAGLQDEHRLYYLSGKAGGAPSDAQIEAKSFTGKRHFRSRGFRMADHRPAEDPCYQDQTIGGYFHMVGAHLVDVPPEDYRTSMMDTFIFSRAKDNYVRLYFRDMIRYSGLYHWDDGDGGDMHWTSNVGQKFFTRSSAADAARGIVTRVSTHGEYAAKVKVLDRQIRSIHAWGLDPSKQHLQREFVRQFAPALESKCAQGSIGPGSAAPPASTITYGAGIDGTTNRSNVASIASFFRREKKEEDVSCLAEEVKLGNNAALKLNKFVLLLASTESSLGKQTNFLHREEYVLDKKGAKHKTVAQHAVAECSHVSESQKRVLFSAVFEKILPGVFELQVDTALASIAQSGTEWTPLERKLQELKVDVASLNQADEDSPALVLPGSRTRSTARPIRVLTNADANAPSESRFLKLEFNSFTFTLASSAVVLYSLESYDVAEAKANNGLAEYELGKRSAYNFNKLSDERWVNLQVSLSVSIAYRVFEDFVINNSYKADAALALLKAVIPDARKHVKNIPVETLLGQVDKIKPFEHFALFNVRLFSPMIQCFEIVRALFKGDSPSETRLDGAFREIKKLRNGSPFDSVSLQQDPLNQVQEDQGGRGVGSDVDFLSTDRLLRGHYKFTTPDVRALEEKAVNDVVMNEIMTNVVNYFPANSAERKSAKAFVQEHLEEIKVLFHLWKYDITASNPLTLPAGFRVFTGNCWLLLTTALVGIVLVDMKNDDLKYRKMNVMMDRLYAGPFKFYVADLWNAIVELQTKLNNTAQFKGAFTTFDNALSKYTEDVLAAPKWIGKQVQTSYLRPRGWYEYLDEVAVKTGDMPFNSAAETIAFRFREYCYEKSGRNSEDNTWNRIMEIDDMKELVKAGETEFWSSSFEKPKWLKNYLATLSTVNNLENKDEKLYEDAVFYKVYEEACYQSGKDKPTVEIKTFDGIDYNQFKTAFQSAALVQQAIDRTQISNSAPARIAAGGRGALSAPPSPWTALTQMDIKDILYSIPIHSGRYLKFCLDHNVPPHIGVLGFRPHKSFRMGTLIYMNRAKAGSTWWGHADFMLADDAARKMHYGNFTIYAKTVITNNKFICLFQNIFCSEYLGGDAHEIFDASDPDQVEDYMAGENMRDIFICAVPIHFDTTRTSFMDITGRFVDSLCCDANTQSLAWYDSADVYRALWGWRHSAQPNSDNMMGKQPKANTMVFQEQQFLFNPTSGRFDYKIDDAGHWGDENIYPGCTRVIQGHEGMFRSAAAVYNRSGAGVGPNDIFGPPGTRPMSA